MDARWFVLKNTHADFATVKAALAVADAAKFGGTWNQTSRVCSFDSTLTIIGSLVTDAELTGDLAPIARANEGTGVFIHELRNQDHKDVTLFDYLGESGYTAYWIINNWTQSAKGATPTAVSTGSGGRTPPDATSWEDYKNIVGRVTSPIRVWIRGDQIPVANSGWSTADLSLPFDSGASAAQRNQYRYDDPAESGCEWQGLLLGSHVTWSDDGVSPGGGTGHIWSTTLPKTCVNFGWVLDPGFDSSGNASPGEFGSMLVTRSTEAEMQNNVNSIWGSAYTSGSTIKVHLAAGEDPANRLMIPVLLPSGGNNACKVISNISTLNQHIEFYECKRRAILDATQWVIDGARFLGGLNSGVGFDCDGSSGTGNTNCMYVNLDDNGRWGTAQAYTGWHIEGFRVRRGAGGLLFNRQDININNTMDSGWYISNIDGEDIGGHDPNYASSDGHVVGFQGDAKNISISGTLRCVNNGNPINFYAFTINNTNPSLVMDQGFAGLTINCTSVNIQGFSEFSDAVGSGNDVGIHCTGDSDCSGDMSGISITLSGTIKDFNRQIRYKWADQATLTSPTNGGLTLSKGTSAQSDAVGIYCMTNALVYEITLASSSGNWTAGDVLADPATPANAIALITKVIDTNPTVTLQYRIVTGTAPTFADTDTVANLSDTGTGTANGSERTIGTLGGNLNYSNINFASDLDTFYEHAGAQGPDGNAADGRAAGFHVQANNNIYNGDSTGKFDSLHGAGQNLTQWKANTDASGDNQYDPDSTNPSS